MSILTWNGGFGTLKKNNGTLLTLHRKPILSFEFDVLLYEPVTGNMTYVNASNPQTLEQSQINEIESFITSYDLTPKHSINEFGSYVGMHPDLGQFTIVPSAPPTNENWVYVNNIWVYVHGVDALGRYMGNVPIQLCYENATSAPSGYLTKWDFNTKTWIDDRTDEQKYLDAIRAIEKQRDQALSDGFMFSGHLYHCDPIFQSQIQSYLLAWREGLILESSTVSIRRKDNVTVSMTKTEILALAAAMISYVEAVYAQSWAAKDAL